MEGNLQNGKALRFVKNDDKRLDAAYAALFEVIEGINSIDIQKGELAREIERLDQKKSQDLQMLLVYGLNYFTTEKIRELHQKSVNILKCDDFDEEDYIKRFSTSLTIKVDDVMFLWNRQNKIINAEEKLNPIPKEPKDEKKATFSSRLVDILMGGDTNNG